MGITNIKQVRNNSSIPIWVLNVRNTNDTGDTPGTKVEPGRTFDHDVWVPWAPTWQDFGERKNHICISAGHGETDAFFCVWQAAQQADGDHVRYSTGGCTWSNPGAVVPGLSEVHGNDDRFLTIEGGPGGLTLRIDHWTAPPPPPPKTGLAGGTLTFIGGPDGQTFTGSSLGAPTGSTISGRLTLSPENWMHDGVPATPTFGGVSLAVGAGAAQEMTQDPQVPSFWYSDQFQGLPPNADWTASVHGWTGAAPGDLGLSIPWAK